MLLNIKIYKNYVFAINIKYIYIYFHFQLFNINFITLNILYFFKVYLSSFCVQIVTTKFYYWINKHLLPNKKKDIYIK